MTRTPKTQGPVNEKAHSDRKRYFASVVGVFLAFTVVLAQSEVGLNRSRAQVTRSDFGRPLTGPSSDKPETIVVGYLRGRGHSAKDVSTSLRTTGVNTGARGVTHVRMEQEIDGLRVWGAYVKAAVNSNGELVHLIDRIYNVTTVSPSRIDASEALNATLEDLYPAELGRSRSSVARGNTTSFDGGSFFYGEPTVTAVALPMDNGTLARGWLVQTWTAKTNELYHTVVDGNGRILDVESRTAYDSYNVFPEDPDKTPQQTLPGGIGWLSGSQTTIKISGPNAHAYLDVDANNGPDAGGTAVTDGNFVTFADLGVSPTTDGNRAVAVQNLFYLNNIAHDLLEGYGFDNAAGNFEGSDPVNAEAQDGSGTDNANFSTPPDGSSPRMQMYLWTGFTPTAILSVNGGEYDAFASAFGPALTTAPGVNGNLEEMVPADGCTTAGVGSLSGSIAVIDRGTCDFTVKVLNAQKAGALAAIIVNNADGNPFGPGGTNRRINIPSAMVSKSDGDILKGFDGVSSNLRKNDVEGLQIDSSLDSDIVFHEYGHGLTWRMIGQMSGIFAGAIGEGASDVNAFLINGDDRIGEYAASDPAGIRRFPYQGYPNTYSDVTGGGVHNDGEIYAGAMWRVLQNYLGAGLTAADLHADFVDGMNNTPSSPKFEDMRDGMLVSVAGSGRECLIWKGFAASGIGVGASGTAKGKRVSINESFMLPAECQ